MNLYDYIFLRKTNRAFVECAQGFVITAVFFI